MTPEKINAEFIRLARVAGGRADVPNKATSAARAKAFAAANFRHLTGANQVNARLCGFVADDPAESREARLARMQHIVVCDEGRFINGQRR